MNKLGQAARNNNGKVQHELFEPFAMNELAKVFTKGNLKYPDPPHNWLYGMSWSKCLASLKRHINAFELGEDFDYDPECKACQDGTCVNHTGLYHMAHAAWNCLALVSYYKYFPQGDNRLHHLLPKPSLGLDIDEVLADFIGPWAKKWGLDPKPTTWFFDGKIKEKFDQMEKEGSLDNFYLSLPVLTKPEDIPWEPKFYVTSRPIDSEVTILWLKKHGFPIKPVITVPLGKSKIDAIKEYGGVDVFVDDRGENFQELNRNGICCYLFDQPHNQNYKAGYRRIKSLKELKF